MQRSKEELLAMMLADLGLLDEVPRAGGQPPPAPTVATMFLKKFAIPVRLAANHVCGWYDDGQFRATLSVTAIQLDGNGSVTDNAGRLLEIQDWFRGAGMLSASCEELAGGLIRVADVVMQGRLMSPRARVYNTTGHVEVIWDVTMGIPVPAFPRGATLEEVRGTIGEPPRRGC